MIKSLKKYQVQSTPFSAIKAWSVNNTDNSDLLLLPMGTQSVVTLALQFLDYGNGSSSPVLNISCSLALNPAPYDLATIEQGLNVTGSFYPDSDPVNLDGTYQRSIYYQVKTAFYNTYYDPSKMWGIENIDFELSKTKRFLSNGFWLIDIPRYLYGDKILPNTITMYIDTYDNPYTVMDDGNGNLFAGTNLFSHQQEIGYFSNTFNANASSSGCNWYWGV
jgi:hypothetical protein